MQISKKQIKPNLNKEIKEVFAQVIADINNRDNALSFLEDFLTETELVALTKRLSVALYLNKGLSYEQIKNELQVSSATIASVQSAMQNHTKGYDIALQYAKANAFATKWSQNIGNLFGVKSG